MDSLKFLNTDAEPSSDEPAITSFDNEALSSQSVQQLLQVSCQLYAQTSTV
jgi:hypothetical protein